MNEFAIFRDQMVESMNALLERSDHLFVVDVDVDKLWETYQNSFPPGTNEVFRERRAHDCSCCRHFVKRFGAVVAIDHESKISIWDFETDSPTYGPVREAMSATVHAAKIVEPFVTQDASIGIPANHEQLENGEVIRWDHFFVKLPGKFVLSGHHSVGEVRGDKCSVRGTFERSFTEITNDAITTVLELTAQNSLYKGEEWKNPLEKFLGYHSRYHRLKTDEARNNFCWSQSAEAGPVVGKIKNHSIGMLLTNISEGMGLDEAVRKYETIVAPTNYKRPKPIVTAAMIKKAEALVEELGIAQSLQRRFAQIEDVTINNTIFANRDARKIMGVDESSITSILGSQTATASKNFNRLEEISIDDFLGNALPKISEIELFFENKHRGNLVSVIAPLVVNGALLFKWGNNFSWAYNGNITDSIKQNVKAAGGNVEGFFRFSIQWNEENDNHDDLDAHCVEPDGNHIYYPYKRMTHRSSGTLDVDIIEPGNQVANENIVWTDPSRMPRGKYELYVHCFTHRGSRSGFAAQVEFNGETYEYSYPNPLRQNQIVKVADLNFERDDLNRSVIKHHLSHDPTKRTEWGISTGEFYPVSLVMYSPNYWDLQTGIGHKHYMFIIPGCINDTAPSGFFNEFLRQELTPHRRVFEALSGRMRVSPSESQLSGLGFSSTKHDSVVCRVKGKINRMMRINF